MKNVQKIPNGIEIYAGKPQISSIRYICFWADFSPWSVCPFLIICIASIPGAFTLNANNSVTINQIGIYLVMGQFDFISNLGPYVIGLSVNGLLLQQSVQQFVATEGNSKYLTTASIVQLTSGDTIAVINANTSITQNLLNSPVGGQTITNASLVLVNLG